MPTQSSRRGGLARKDIVGLPYPDQQRIDTHAGPFRCIHQSVANTSVQTRVYPWLASVMNPLSVATLQGQDTV